MQMLDKKLLAYFSWAGPCCFCGRSCVGRVVHHLRRRGTGGGSRLEIALALAGLCPSVPGYYTGCHDRVHCGKQNPIGISDAEMLAKVAERERTRPEHITAVCNFLLAHPKHLPVTRDRCLEWGLTSPQAALACNAYQEWFLNNIDQKPKRKCGLGARRKRRTA
jgi:hypothetical protein